METVRLHRAINSLLECSFCLEVYEDPRMLPCGHTFCLKCLLKQYETFSSNNNEIKCGICRELSKIPKQGVDSLPKNFVVQSCSMVFPSLSKCSIENDNIEHGKVEYFCIECWDPFCTSCKDAHRKTKYTKNHTLKNITEISKEDVDIHKKQVELICSQHKNQELTLFCTNCKEIGCPTCSIKSHSKHDSTDLIEADKNFIDKINSWLDVLRKKEENLQFQIKVVNKSITSLYFDHAFSVISTAYFIDDIKKTLLSLLEIIFWELDQCKKKVLLAATEKMDEENSRFQKYLATKKDTLQKLQNEILLHENYLLSSSSVNERLQFTKRQELKADSEFREQDSTNSDSMTYDLVDVTQWRCDIEKWKKTIITVLNTAVNLPQLKTDNKKNEFSVRDECGMPACEQRNEVYSVFPTDESIVTPGEGSTFPALEKYIAPSSEKYTESAECSALSGEKYDIHKLEENAICTTGAYVFLYCDKFLTCVKIYEYCQLFKKLISL